MAEQEGWIAECHLVEIGGDAEYSCKAAVWADDVGAVRSLLDAKFQPLGYKVLWLDGCLPVRQYLSNHGGQAKIAPLARAVHPGHLVELSRLVDVGEAGEAEPESYLIIEEIEGVEPLDAQLGVHPRKNIPDALMEPLFGQLEPTEAEIEHYGSAEVVPPMRTYAILDAGKFQFGRSVIERCDLPFKCLFKGDTAEELKDVAPYLIELSAEADFTRRLLTHNPNMPDTMTTVHLWHKEPGIYIRSRASFETLWKHFRKFTRIQDENGKWFLWRYWEPQNLSIYQHVRNHAESPFVAIFNPANLHSILLASSSSIHAIQPNPLSRWENFPLRLKKVDFEAMEKAQTSKFLKRVTSEILNRTPGLNQLDDVRIKAAYIEGREKGYTIEMASFNYIYAALLADRKSVSLQKIEEYVDNSGVLSPLNRSKAILQHLKNMGSTK